MRTFKKIYSYEVIKEVEQGKQVRILDRETEKIYRADELYAVDFLEAINSKEENRYDFWVVENTEDKNE